MPKPILHIAEILRWADAHHERTGKWPKETSGPVPEAIDTTWMGINRALQSGNRGLRGGSSLARLLKKRRGVRNHYDLPKLTVKQILAWADKHHRRTGNWPNRNSGPVHGMKGETWSGIDAALHSRLRGLRTHSSLAAVLQKHRRVKHYMRKPVFTTRQIIAWADEHHARTGIFLAMALWSQPEPATDEAESYYQQAVEWMEQNRSANLELQRIRAEADEVRKAATAA